MDAQLDGLAHSELVAMATGSLFARASEPDEGAGEMLLSLIAVKELRGAGEDAVEEENVPRHMKRRSMALDRSFAGGLLFAQGGAAKTRLVALSVKRQGRVRLHKLRLGASRTLEISKTWHLEDVRSVELGMDMGRGTSNQLVVNVGRTYVWQVQDHLDDFLAALVQTCRAVLRRMPRLANVDEAWYAAQALSDAAAQQLLAATCERLAAATLGASGPAGRAAGPGAEAARPAGGAAGTPGAARAEASPNATPAGPSGPPAGGLAGAAPAAADAVELAEVLATFQWDVSADATALEERLAHELQALEAANVHALIQSQEPSRLLVQQVDRAIVELNAVDAWLSSYTGMLEHMGQDVQEIEAKNKGLQVASTSQRLLLEELEELVSHLQIAPWVVEALSKERLDTSAGIYRCEDAAAALAALLTHRFPDSLASMAAVRERMQLFTKHGAFFTARLSQYLHGKLTASADAALSGDVSSAAPGHAILHDLLVPYTRLIQLSRDFDARRQLELQMDYASVLGRVYAREIGGFVELARQLLLPPGSQIANVAGASALDDALVPCTFSARDSQLGSALRSAATAVAAVRGALGPTGSMGTAGSLQAVSQGGAARRAQRKSALIFAQLGGSSLFAANVKSVAAMLDDGSASAAQVRMAGDELFVFVLDTVLPVVLEEQAYLLRVIVSAPSEKDVRARNRLRELLSTIFDTLAVELLGLVALCTKQDATVLVGLAAHVERLFVEHRASATGAADAESPLERSADGTAAPPQKTASFIEQLLEKCLKRLLQAFGQFLDEQARALADPAVAMRKRNGIFASVERMPVFIDRLEQQLDGWSGRLRDAVDQGYQRLMRQLFETLARYLEASPDAARDGGLSDGSAIRKHLAALDAAAADAGTAASGTVPSGHSRTGSASMAKTLGATLLARAGSSSSVLDAPEAPGLPGAAAARVKERDALAVHVLMIDNMHQLHTAVRARKVRAFDAWLRVAKSSYDEHLGAYVQAMVRRPFGRLYDFFDGVERLAAASQSAEDVSFHFSHNRAALKELIFKYPAKDVRDALRALHRRVAKHFSERDGLLQVVWHSISDQFVRDVRQMEELIAKCYPNSGLRLDFSTLQVLSFFSEIAQLGH